MAGEFVAVVTAAGESTRMGGFPKPLLVFDGDRFVDRLAGTYQAAGIDDVLVVLGHEAAEIRDRAALTDVTVRENPDYADGMLSSVQVGVRYARERDAAGLLLNPVDCPLVPPTVVETIATAARTDHADTDVLVPTVDGGRGHPPLFAATAFDPLLDAPIDQGARAVVNSPTTDTHTIDVDDDRIFVDIDTPADYWTAVKRYEPTRD